MAMIRLVKEAPGIPFLKVGFHAAKNITLIMQKLLKKVSAWLTL